MRNIQYKLYLQDSSNKICPVVLLHAVGPSPYLPQRCLGWDHLLNERGTPAT